MSRSMLPSDFQERAFALQKYMLLHSQHDALHKHLDNISALVPLTPTVSRSSTRSRESSLSSSPESPETYLNPVLFETNPNTLNRHHHRSSLPSSGSSSTRIRPRMIKRRSSLPVIIDENEILASVQDEECKLHDVNEQIKCTLTELLNCESVRNDARYRMWVQQRLMNTEKELKGERMRICERKRRMSDAGSLSENIGDHFH